MTITDPPPSWFHEKDPVVFEVAENYADRTLLYGMPNERYRIFWTYDRALFDRFASELDTDAEHALDTWKAGHYMMEPFGMLEPFGRTAPLGGPNFLSEWERGAIPRVLFPGDSFGYHAGWYFENSVTPAVFDATPPSLRALYACEWLQWCCERIVQEEPDWPYLWTLTAVIEAAQSGAPIPDLAKMLPAGGEMGKRAAEMRTYLYECAKRGIRHRGLVANAINVGSEASTTGLGGWRSAAEEIAEETGLAHPALPHQSHLDQFYFSDRTKAALVAYFDMYALGFDHKADAAPIALHAAHVRETLGWIRAKQQALLKSFRHHELMRELAQHVAPADFPKRPELADRYHLQCANVDVRFWEDAAVQLATHDAWDRMVPFLGWLGESEDLLAEMFKGLLEKYAAAYRLRVESVETMVRYLYRYHLLLKGSDAEQILPQGSATLRVDCDPLRQRAIAKLYRGARETLIGRYELLTKLVPAEVGEAHAPLGPTHSDHNLRLLRRAMRAGKVREFVMAESSLEVPQEDKLSGFPRLLASTAGLLKAGLALSALLGEAQTKKLGDIEFDIYLEVAEECFQAVGPGTDILQSVFRNAGVTAQQAASHPFVRAGTALSTAGGVIEASRHLWAGGQTLATLLRPISADTDLANYLERGETVPAWLEGTKGVLQLATGGLGFGALVLGASTTVATLPLSVLVAVGSVAVATLKVVIYAETGGGSPVDAYLKDLRRARRKQFKLSTEDRILKPDEEVVLGETIPDSGRAGTAACRLAQKLGAVNELAKRARLVASTGSRR